MNDETPNRKMVQVHPDTHEMLMEFKYEHRLSGMDEVIRELLKHYKEEE